MNTDDLDRGSASGKEPESRESRGSDRPRPPLPGDEDNSPDRRRITGADPWVQRPHGVQRSSGRASTSTGSLPPHERRHRRGYDDQAARRSSARLRRQRNQSIWLGFMFAALALIVFFATQLFSPTLVVTLDGGEGTVLLNGDRIGRTGEVLTAPMGPGRVQVLPDDSTLRATPAELRVDFGYDWTPVALKFRTEPIPR